MDELETQFHVLEAHKHAIPECFEKDPAVSWSAVHKLVHDLAKKRGDEPHQGVKAWEHPTRTT